MALLARRWRRALSSLAVPAVVILAVVPALAASETPIVTGKINQRRPAAGSVGVAWSVFVKGNSNAWATTGGAPFRVDPSKAGSATGGISGNSLVYQRYNRRGSDLAWVDLSTQIRLPDRPHLNSGYWEWGPSVSGNWVVFSRNNINYGEKREWQRVLLVNTSTGETRELAKTGAKYFLNAAQVNGNWVVWEAWSKTGGRVYLYDIAGDSLVVVGPIGKTDPYAPAVAEDGTMYYSRSGDACGRNVIIQRRRPDGTIETIHSFPKGVDAWEIYEFTDATPEQDLYYSRVDCDKADWQGDIYRIDAADTAPAIAAPAVDATRDQVADALGSPRAIPPESRRPVRS